MNKYKVSEYKIFNGKRYKLASQDMSKTKSKQLAKELRNPVKGLKTMNARIVKEKYQKGFGRMSGRYRVYATQR